MRTCAELLVIAIIFVGLLNEDKLIRWEDKIIRKIRRREK